MDTTKCGEFISKLRAEKGMTQKQLAETLNVSDKAVSRWETGKGYPDVSSLMALSDFFAVSVNELLSGERMNPEKLVSVADENIIETFRKAESNKIRQRKQVAAYSALLIIAVSPVLIILAKNLFEAFKTQIKAENIVTAIVSSAAGIALLIAGIVIKRGNLSVLHSYHYENVTDSEGYARAMGLTLALMSLPVFVHSFLSLFYQVKAVSVAGITVLLMGLIVGAICIFRVQAEYNGDLF